MKMKRHLISTKTELENFVANLEKLTLDIKGIQSEKLESYLVKNYDSEFIARVSVSLPNGLNKANTNLVTDVEELFKSTKDTLENSLQVKLTLAFIPDEKFIKSLYEWFEQNTEIEVLLDIDTDRSIIAGAIVSSDGKYMDDSARSKLNKYGRFI